VATLCRAQLARNALVEGQTSELRDVDCASANNCSAVGEYFDNYRAYPRSQGFVATEVRGHWSRASEVTMAQKANFNPFVSFAQLACSSLGKLRGRWIVIDAHDVTEDSSSARCEESGTRAKKFRSPPTRAPSPARHSAKCRVSLTRRARRSNVHLPKPVHSKR